MLCGGSEAQSSHVVFVAGSGLSVFFKAQSCLER
jgi:hypothetical protein